MFWAWDPFLFADLQNHVSGFSKLRCSCLEVLLIESQSRKECSLSPHYLRSNIYYSTLFTEPHLQVTIIVDLWNTSTLFSKHSLLHFWLRPLKLSKLSPIPVVRSYTGFCGIEKGLNSYHTASCHICSAVCAEVKPLVCQRQQQRSHHFL